MSKFLVEYVMGQLETFNSSDGGFLASHSSQHAGKHFSSVSYHKRSHQGCFGRSSIQRSAITTLNHLAAQRHVLHRQGSFSSVCQEVGGVTQACTGMVYQ